MKMLDAFEKDIFWMPMKRVKQSPPLLTTARLAKFKAAAKATFLEEKRVNVCLSTPYLMDICLRALEEGMPYQTLIASVPYKIVTGLLVEPPSSLTPALKRAAPTTARPL